MIVHSAASRVSNQIPNDPCMPAGLPFCLSQAIWLIRKPLDSISFSFMILFIFQWQEVVGRDPVYHHPKTRSDKFGVVPKLL
jgi:hypothetical protein